MGFAASALRHPYTTRLLFSLLPSACYAAHDRTLEGLHEVLADDLSTLFRDGITVTEALLHGFRESSHALS